MVSSVHFHLNQVFFTPINLSYCSKHRLISDLDLSNKECMSSVSLKIYVVKYMMLFRFTPATSNYNTFPQVFRGYLELLKTAVMALQEIRVSLESQAEQAGLGTRDLLESVTRQLAREHHLLGNPPAPKTIKHNFLH